MYARLAALLLLTPAILPAQEKPQTSPYTLSTNSQLVLVDVTVHDKHGDPVHGLAQSAFELSEDSHPQTIRNFDEHIAPTDAEAVKILRPPPLPPGDFTNLTRATPGAALEVVLIDCLNTSRPDQAFLTARLSQYLRTARPDARIAIFGLGEHLVQLKGFSSDPAVLLKAIEMKASARPSSARPDTPGADTSSLAPDSASLDQGGVTATLVALSDFDQANSSLQAQLRAKYTLHALTQLGNLLVNIPGRKNLVWFAGEFPQNFLPSHIDPSQPFALFADREDQFRETINLLTRSRVAVYPVPAHGVAFAAVNDASNQPSVRVAGPATSGTQAGADTMQSIGDQSDQHLRERAAMDEIARQTGGIASPDSNDLAKATHTAIANGSDFYTIAYIPDATNLKPGLRTITVKVSGGKYTLGYRRGYYVTAASAQPPKAPNMTPLRQALFPGAPTSSDLLLRAHITPQPGEQTTVDKTNSPNPAVPFDGPFHTLKIDISASAQHMQFQPDSTDHFHTDLTVTTYVFDANGQPINSQSGLLQTNFDKPTMTEIAIHGIPFHQQLSVPANAPYLLRIAVFDSNSTRTGSLEIPSTSITALPTEPQP